MASLGWQDPTWQQLYGSSSQMARGPSAEPPAVPAMPVPDGNIHYLDQIQAAAAAGQDFNLSDMAGFQTNFTEPQPGDENF
jgi:hypothetical protein